MCVHNYKVIVPEQSCVHNICSDYMTLCCHKGVLFYNDCVELCSTSLITSVFGRMPSEIFCSVIPTFD